MRALVEDWEEGMMGEFFIFFEIFFFLAWGCKFCLLKFWFSFAGQLSGL